MKNTHFCVLHGRRKRFTFAAELQWTSTFILYKSLLATGIFSGAVWANISWGNYWSWDPKETWALITLMIYAVPIHQSMPCAGSNHPSYHLLMLMAFLSLLMTYFGVNCYLAGLHSYGVQ